MLSESPGLAGNLPVRGAAGAPLVWTGGWEELAVEELEAHALAGSTRRGYRGHLRAWERWCADRQLSPLPAAVNHVREHLAWFLVSRDETGQPLRDASGALLTQVTAASVTSRLAAISKAHELAGYPSPARDPAVRELLRGIRRKVGIRPRRQRAALLSEHLVKLVRACDGLDVRVLRRDALLLLRVRTGATSGQLARLTWPSIALEVGEVLVSLPSTSRGAPPPVVRVPVHRDARLCLHQILTDLRSVAVTQDGPVLATGDGRPLSRQLLHRELAALWPPDMIVSSNPAVRDALLRPLVAARRGAPLKAYRDKAMLLVAFAAALRCDDLARLSWGDLRREPGGEWSLLLRRSKTDQEGAGAELWVPALDAANRQLCPAIALAAWHAAVTEQTGADPLVAAADEPVFPAVTVDGKLRRRPDGSLRRLRPDYINTVVAERVVAAGLHDPATGDNPYGGHSMRAGFITSAARDGMTPLEIQSVTRHRSLDTLAEYVRVEDMRRRNLAGQLMGNARDRRATGGGRAPSSRRPG